MVRWPSERVNSQFCIYSAMCFNNFIHEAGLTDLSMGGRRFTYMRDDDLKLSKLDRFLVCSNFLTAQPHSSVKAFPYEFSDHSPIILSSSQTDFGPPLFRFFNSWMLNNKFD